MDDFCFEFQRLEELYQELPDNRELVDEHWRTMVKDTVAELGEITELNEYERGLSPCLEIVRKKFKNS